MAVYNKVIQIQKLNQSTEAWEDYYQTHANINKTSGKEYFTAKTDITSTTFNFAVRYCTKLEDILFNTEEYRIIYENRCFNIKNVDNFMLKNQELIIVGDFNGKYFNK